MKCPICNADFKPRVIGEKVSTYLEIFEDKKILDMRWEQVKDQIHYRLSNLTENFNKTILVCPMCSYAINNGDLNVRPDRFFKTQ